MPRLVKRPSLEEILDFCAREPIERVFLEDVARRGLGRFAALRATATDIAPMEGAYARMERYKASQDFEAFSKADIDFHTALLRASRNIVFQQLSNTIGAALAYSFRLTIARAREPGASLPNHGEVIERIRLRDAEGAYASMARLLNIAIVDLGIHQ